jgi:hypothetical protein
VLEQIPGSGKDNFLRPIPLGIAVDSHRS